MADDATGGPPSPSLSNGLSQTPVIPPPTTTTTTDDTTHPTADAPLEQQLDTKDSTTTTMPSIAPLTNGIHPTADPLLPPTTATILAEPRIPHKKDASLRDFLSKTDDYTPLIPDAVTDYYLTLAGLPPPPNTSTTSSSSTSTIAGGTDRRLARLLALATQKFIADIAADAYQYSRIRSTNTTSNNPLTGLGGAAGFGVDGGDGAAGQAGKGGRKEDKKGQPALGGPRAGFGGGGGATGQNGRTVLTMEDLGMAVGEYGVNVKRGEFYR